MLSSRRLLTKTWSVTSHHLQLWRLAICDSIIEKTSLKKTVFFDLPWVFMIYSPGIDISGGLSVANNGFSSREVDTHTAVTELIHERALSSYLVVTEEWSKLEIIQKIRKGKTRVVNKSIVMSANGQDDLER